MSEFTIEENSDLQPLNTLAIPAKARYLVTVSNDAELEEAVEFAKGKGLRVFPLGSGSNIVLANEVLEAVVVRLETTGISMDEKKQTHTDITVNAGHIWDELVQWSVENDLAGIESMTIVPGTVGAAPVQNVGCYGQEVSETITRVRAYDTDKQAWVTLSNADCRFGYRDSLFKTAEGKRFIITQVSFRLVSGETAPVPQYATLQAELVRRGIEGRPTLHQIRDALIAVRTSRLPDPAKVPTAGSFFHNPIVPAEVYLELVKKNPGMPHFPVPDARVKLLAPWLIDQCGLKGYEKNGIGMYEKQAVALINPGKRPGKEVIEFRDMVTEKVQERFGIALRMEPELVV